MHMIRVAACLTAVLLLLSGPVIAATSQLKSISLATADRHARLLFDLSDPVKSSMTHDAAHRQLLIRFQHAKMAATLRHPPVAQPYVQNITASTDSAGTCIRVDLKKSVGARLFSVMKGKRWVVQLSSEPQGESKDDEGTGMKPTVASSVGPTSGSSCRTTAKRVVERPRQLSQDRVIAIDAGHGGKDTGAIGPRGTREKDVVFAIARKLAGMVRAEAGMRAVLVRKSDQFIDLRQRTEIARRAKADMFVSLHADAYINADAKGSAVFTLSEHGASSVAARWLADRENSADLIGGVKLRDKGKVLASVLLDLSQSATAEASDRAATRVLAELGKRHQLHHHQVQKAGFVVLKSPDIPSLLVETGFISNPEEEQRLINDKYQERIARAIFWGIQGYFANRKYHEPPNAKVKTVGDGRLEVVAQE